MTLDRARAAAGAHARYVRMQFRNERTHRRGVPAGRFVRRHALRFGMSRPNAALRLPYAFYLAGFAIGTISGSAIGLSLWWSTWHAKVAEPFPIVFEGIPQLALAGDISSGN